MTFHLKISGAFLFLYSLIFLTISTSVKSGPATLLNLKTGGIIFFFFFISLGAYFFYTTSQIKRRGLTQRCERALMWVLTYRKYKCTVFEISQKSGLGLEVVERFLKDRKKSGLKLIKMNDAGVVRVEKI